MYLSNHLSTSVRSLRLCKHSATCNMLCAGGGGGVFGVPAGSGCTWD